MSYTVHTQYLVGNFRRCQLLCIRVLLAVSSSLRTAVIKTWDPIPKSTKRSACPGSCNCSSSSSSSSHEPVDAIPAARRLFRVSRNPTSATLLSPTPLRPGLGNVNDHGGDPAHQQQRQRCVTCIRSVAVIVLRALHLLLLQIVRQYTSYRV